MAKKHPHKFIASGAGYHRTIHCEHCGIVVFHGNFSDDPYYRGNEKRAAEEGCPLAPETKRKDGVSDG